MLLAPCSQQPCGLRFHDLIASRREAFNTENGGRARLVPIAANGTHRRRRPAHSKWPIVSHSRIDCHGRGFERAETIMVIERIEEGETQTDRKPTERRARMEPCRKIE